MKRSQNLSRRTFLQTSITTATAALGATCLTQPVSASPAQAGPWQIGCYTRVFDRWDYRTGLDAIAEAGYRHVGLMTTKQTADQKWVLITSETPIETATRIGDEVKQRGLSVPSIYADGGGVSRSKSVAEGVGVLKRILDNAQACGAGNLLMGGINATGEPYDRYYQIIAECCDYAQTRGIGISVKPHGGSNATGPQCRKAIDKVNHSNFRIWYDPGNTFYYSEGKLDPVDDVPTVSDVVVGMCIKDYLPPKHVYVTPGTGRVDFPTVLKKLVAGGFTRGPLVVECVKRDGDLKQTVAEARQARLYLEEVIKGL